MSWPTYLGYDLFLTEPNFDTEPKISLVNRQTLVSGIRVGYNHHTFIENPLRIGFNYLLDDIAAVKDTIDFFNDKKGRFHPFFMPSWTRDIKITGAISPDSSVLTIENIDYATTWQRNKALGRHLIIFLEDGTYLCRKIYSAKTSTTIKLNQALGITRTAAQASVLFCCFLHFVRFDIDELELLYETLDVAECELTFQTLNVAADGTASECVFVSTTTSTTTSSSSTTTSTTSSSTTTTSTMTTTSTTSSSTTTTVDMEGCSVASPYNTWWNGHVATVGPTGRDYTSIRAAMVAVASGTLILIDAGTYTFGEYYYCTKTLLIRGIGAAPTNVVIDNNQATGQMFSVSGNGRLLIENLTMNQKYDWRHCLTLSGTGSASIVASKCYLYSSSYPQYKYLVVGEDSWENGTGTLKLLNCKLTKTYADKHFFQHLLKEHIYLTKSEFDTTVGADIYGTTFADADCVTTPTVNYGYAYGTPIITVP